ncbi:unnamed protein product [Phytomonas sp. EM1]|nr:unnamed protein product [Phytomonas sp. EM1]|eukprot:CCW61428.1 unnamed protein product [Phytomonas sp. isolate EM1]
MHRVTLQARCCAIRADTTALRGWISGIIDSTSLVSPPLRKLRYQSISSNFTTIKQIYTAKMSEQCNKYLADTWNRDKVMAIVQFAPMMLAGPVKALTGSEELSKAFFNLSNMADAYRAVTRLSLLLRAVSKENLTALAKPQGDAYLERSDQLTHFFHVLFCLFENTTTLAKHGALCTQLRSFGQYATVCWFYTLLLGVVRQIYVLTHSKTSKKERNQLLVTLLKLGCFLVFALTCMPKDGLQLLPNAPGAIVPLHKTIALITPKHLQLSDTIRGALGFVASMCDFY